MSEFFGHVWSNPQNKIVSNFRKLDVYHHGKLNSITHFFLKILQRYCILVILRSLGMPGHAHQIWWDQLVENFDVYLHIKSTSSLTSFFRFFLNWDSLHARLNSHYKVWSCKKKKHKKVKAYGKSSNKCPRAFIKFWRFWKGRLLDGGVYKRVEFIKFSTEKKFWNKIFSLQNNCKRSKAVKK